MTWRSLATIGLTFGFLVFGSTGLAAAAGPPPAPTILKLDTSSRFDSKGAKVPGQFILSATLTTSDGKPISDREIRFVQTVDTFGTQDAFLGSSVTDATGNATLLFQPAQTGTARLKAQFTGDAQLAAQSATFSQPVTTALPAFKSDPLPLAGVATVLSVSVAVGAWVLWAVLIGVLLMTTLRIRAAGRSAQP